MKTAVIYSCHLENRAHEPENWQQIALCKEFAEQNGIEIIDSYWDYVTTKKEPLLMKKRLLEECRNQHWDMVLFSSITILGRNLKHIMKFLNEISKYLEYKIVNQENDKLLKEIGKWLKTLHKERRL